MNPQPDRDLERRQIKLETELNQTPPPVPLPKQPLQQETDNSQLVQSAVNRFINWFNGLSGFGKLSVMGVVALVGLFILRAVLQLVAAVFSLAILCLILYFGYYFITKSTSQPKE